MKIIHFFMQGKGGSGKTTSCSFFTEYVKNLGIVPFCYDIDPLNNSFHDFKEHKVQFFDITNGSTEIIPRLFDKFSQEIMFIEDGNIIVDTGAATFLPFLNYVKDNELISVLEENAQVFIHVPIAGGAAFKDCLLGLHTVLSNFPEVKVVVWKNYFFGELVDIESGKKFEETKLYSEYQEKIFGVVEIPKKDKSTFGVDIEQFLAAKLTLTELNLAPKIELFPKIRIKKFYAELFNNLNSIDIELKESENA